jgi:hypothetical protein
MTLKSLLLWTTAVLISVAFTSSALAGGNVKTLILTTFKQNLMLVGRDIKTGNSELHGGAASTVSITQNTNIIQNLFLAGRDVKVGNIELTGGAANIIQNTDIKQNLFLAGRDIKVGNIETVGGVSISQHTDLRNTRMVNGTDVELNCIKVR